MNVLDWIIETGVKKQNPDFINEKIKITNSISLFYAMLNVPFIYFTYLLFPSIGYIPVVFLAMTLSVIFVFNRIGNYELSRFALIVGSNLIYLVFHCYLLQENQEPQGALYILHTSFIILPWIVIDFREMGKMIAYSIIVALGLISVPTLNNYFDYKVDVSLLQTGYLFYLFALTSIFGCYLAFFFLSRVIFLSDKSNRKLIQEFDIKNQALNDNEAKLNSYIEEIKIAQEEEKKRNWASDGMSQFVEILRSNNDELKYLSEVIISKLTNYLKVNQGSILVLNEDDEKDKYLELTAVYAYDRKRFQEKRIEIGQGLVGQAFLEKDVIYLKKVPQEYIQITSGLGEATPSSVLIVPLVINEKVYGVIELASFRPFEQFEIDFLKKLGENIAGTFSNVRVNEKTRKLLEETKLGQEQIRSQEEEVRQNMEELQATQEELIRKSNEIEELRMKEKERTESQLAAQRKIMEQVVAKSKKTEQELQNKIKELEAKLNV